MFLGKDNGIDRPSLPVNSPTFHLVLGILCAVIGVLKLLSPIANGIFFLGDLLPGAAGITAGLILVFGIYRQNSAVKSNQLDKVGANLLVFRKPVAFGLITVAILHFIFGNVVFL